MEGIDLSRRWKILKQRMGFKGMGCCGAIWSPTPSTMPLTRVESNPNMSAGRVPQQDIDDHRAPHIVGPTGMNLAMALAAERHSNVGLTDGMQVKTLMRLIEETDGVDWNNKRKDKIGVHVGDCGYDGLCCVCMERNKGAAFIPCGHTYCRVCSRELWVNRGSCPLCNRSILEILDIF